ncbi:hypothetical protein N9C64_03325, partial [Paracoccaceae bacterium]|nr:hypothetical protein [Paracoccaceae bacterium]
LKISLRKNSCGCWLQTEQWLYLRLSMDRLAVPLRFGWSMRNNHKTFYLIRHNFVAVVQRIHARVIDQGMYG